MALQRQPMYQRAMQKAHAKASMRGNRAQTAGLQSRLAEMDLARKLAFKGIGLQKKRSDLAHKGRMASFDVRKKELKDRKAQLPWQIGIGAGTALLSGLEGKRQANIIKANEEAAAKRHTDIMNREDEKEARYWERNVYTPHRSDMRR